MSPKFVKSTWIEYSISKYRWPERQRRWFVIGMWKVILFNPAMEFVVFGVDLSLLAMENIFQNRHKPENSYPGALWVESIPSKGSDLKHPVLSCLEMELLILFRWEVGLFSCSELNSWREFLFMCIYIYFFFPGVLKSIAKLMNCLIHPQSLFHFCPSPPLPLPPAPKCPDTILIIIYLKPI